MKNNKIINSITLGAMFAAIYGIFSAISIYVLQILSVVGLFIMPIFAAYYASIYKFKETLLFNISVLVVCFLVGIADPIYCLIYVLPTLIVGDIYGLLSRLKIKFYTTMILQTITYSITNILALVLAEKLYDTEIIRFIISDEWTYQNLSLSILFVLSGAEAVVSCAFSYEQLAKIKIYKEKEKQYPMYGYIAIIILTILASITYFINNNVYFLCITIAIVTLLGLVYELTKHPRRKLIFILYIIICSITSLTLLYFSFYRLVLLALLIPFAIYSVFIIVQYLINKKSNNS